MSSPKIQRHPLKDSCFYRLSNKQKLAEILFKPLSELKALSKKTDNYSSWEEAKPNGGVRRIDAPSGQLKAIQKRIDYLLKCIEPPGYLIAPVKGKSYVDNAAVHVGASSCHLLDLENFFPSCTDKRVYWFFHKIMLCSTDIAALLTKLATYNGSLPQGSPCSPMLGFFAYLDMWEAIDSIVSKAGGSLSVYIDDITISAEIIHGSDIWAIKQIIHKYGLRYSKKKERSVIDKPVKITGVVVAESELRLPNSQHKTLSEVRKQRAAAKSKKSKGKLDRQLRGRLAQKKQILDHDRSQD